MEKLNGVDFRLSCKNYDGNNAGFNNISGVLCPVGNDFYALFNTIQDLLFVVDLQGKIFFYNQPFEQHLGFSQEELKDKELFQIYHFTGRDDVKKALESVAHEHSTSFTIPLTSKNGKELPVETRLFFGTWGAKQAIIGTCRDISERLHYEQQLLQSSQRLEMVLLASDAGWWDWNIKSDHLLLNDKWCSMRGYLPGEIKPQVDSWKKLVHPDDLPLALQNLQNHLDGKSPFYQAEYRAKTKSGSFMWIFDTGKVTEFDSAGSPLRVVGTNIDITSHKENELKLQKNLHQQELLSEIALELNSLDDFDIRINKTLAKIGNHTDVSRVYIFEDFNEGLSTCNTFEWCNNGVTPQLEELQDVPYEIIPSWKKILLLQGRVYSENIQELPEDLRNILEPQQIKSIVIYPLYVKGCFFGFIGFDECTRYKNWTRSELELLRTVSGIIANAYERRLSEKSLQDSESKNRAILESIPDILFHFDKDGRILSYRSSSLEDLAIHPSEFITKSIFEIFPEEFSSKVKKAIDLCLEKGSFKFDYMLKVQGELNDYEARMAKMNENEVIAIVRNVSERKNYERQLTEERDKANQANKAKSEFLANMSHEIRTPMNAILGFSEALYHKIDSPHHQKMIKSILSSGTLLLTLLNDILDLSKIEAGMLEISRHPVDLMSINKEIKLLFLSKAEKKNIEINLFFSENFPKLLMLDEIRVKQVIFNIVGNAIKFTNTGYVNIKARFTGTSAPCGVLHIDVEDSGIGIPLSQQEIIFETFRQQSGQSNRLYEGAGLGLAISKRLVEKMNGSISVKSEVGRGSTFTVTLPCSSESGNENIEADSFTDDVNVVFEPCEILVVDDVELNIEAVQNLLDGSGVTVNAARNGEIALEILKHTQPKLILLDLRMPGMSGYEVARQIKEDETMAKIPVIAYTASVFGSEHGRNSGNFNGFLYKPINRNALYGELMKYLNYKWVEQTKIATSSEEISLDNIPEHVIANLPAFYEEVLLHLFPRWESIKDQLILFKIEEFAAELRKLGEKYEFEYVIRYADKLKDDLEMVDLESLKKSLEDFPEIVTRVSKLI